MANGNLLLKQCIYIQNLSQPEFFVNSTSARFKLLHFRSILVRRNEHSIKFLELTDYV